MNLIKSKSLAKKIFFIVSIALYSLYNTPTSHAQTIMSNDQYEIHMGNINSFSSKIKVLNGNTSSSGEKSFPSTFSGPNYTASVGLPSTRNSYKPFSMSVSSLFIDYGPINPGPPLTRTNIISVSQGSSNGYSILAYQDHPLQSQEEYIIPDTTCDEGVCDEVNASRWSSVLTFGFGFRCDNIEGMSCTSDFKDSSYFKQFADQNSDEIPQPILKSVPFQDKAEAEISYKINISSSQYSSLYSNTITYIALPSI